MSNPYSAIIERNILSPISQGDFSDLYLLASGLEAAYPAPGPVTTTQQGGTGVDEIQVIGKYANPGGSYTLTVAGVTTAPIAYNANAATIEAAIDAAVGHSDIAVTGGPLSSADVTLTFSGDSVDETDQPLTTVNQVAPYTGDRPPARYMIEQLEAAHGVHCPALRKWRQKFATMGQMDQ